MCAVLCSPNQNPMQCARYHRCTICLPLGGYAFSLPLEYLCKWDWKLEYLKMPTVFPTSTGLKWIYLLILNSMETGIRSCPLKKNITTACFSQGIEKPTSVFFHGSYFRKIPHIISCHNLHTQKSAPPKKHKTRKSRYQFSFTSVHWASWME